MCGLISKDGPEQRDRQLRFGAMQRFCLRCPAIALPKPPAYNRPFV